MEETPSLHAVVRRWQAPLIALAVLVVAGLLTAAYFTWFHQPYAVLFKDLRAADAATIVAELDKRKTPYQLRDGGRTILAPAKLVDATRLAVMSQDLPLKGVVGFELFSKSDMGLTEFAQRINYRRALQGEIARTIMALDTVESARVHLSLSEASVFREDRKPAKASVTLIPRGGRPLPPGTIRGVQRLVAAAVADLDPAAVVILDESGAVVSALPAAAPPDAPPAVQQQTAIEAYYAGRVRLALRRLLPDDQVQTKVSAGWGPAAPQADDADPFADWSPATRRFPLTVTVTTTTPVGPEVRDQLLGLAARAVGLRPEAGDAVSVAYAPPAAPVSAELASPTAGAPHAPPTAAAPPPSSPARAPAAAGWVWLAAPLLVALLAAAVVLHRRGLATRRLTERERAAYAERLRALLDGRPADVAPRP